MFSVSSVSKSYGKNKVLTDVSLSVSPGECIALLGINGSGKSTLLGILSRNIKPHRLCQVKLVAHILKGLVYLVGTRHLVVGYAYHGILHEVVIFYKFSPYSKHILSSIRVI